MYRLVKASPVVSSTGERVARSHYKGISQISTTTTSRIAVEIARLHLRSRPRPRRRRFNNSATKDTTQYM